MAARSVDQAGPIRVSKSKAPLEVVVPSFSKDRTTVLTTAPLTIPLASRSVSPPPASMPSQRRPDTFDLGSLVATAPPALPPLFSFGGPSHEQQATGRC